jgi:hypothetical protein
MRTVIGVLFLSASALGAQTEKAEKPVSTIDPGMTREQVVATIGEPLSSRSYQGFTYLLYKNGCEKKCGMNDLVVLDSGKVVDAVFRAHSRAYSGTSSSPKMISASDAKHGSANAAPLTVHPPKKPSPAT